MRVLGLLLGLRIGAFLEPTGREHADEGGEDGRVTMAELTVTVPTDGSAAALADVLARLAAEGVPVERVSLRRPTCWSGTWVASVARNLVATALVVGVALLIGFRPTAGLAECLGVLGVLVLFMVAMSVLAAAFGLAARSPEAARRSSRWGRCSAACCSAAPPLLVVGDHGGGPWVGPSWRWI